MNIQKLFSCLHAHIYIHLYIDIVYMSTHRLTHTDNRTDLHRCLAQASWYLEYPTTGIPLEALCQLGKGNRCCQLRHEVTPLRLCEGIPLEARCQLRNDVIPRQLYKGIPVAATPCWKLPWAQEGSTREDTMLNTEPKAPIRVAQIASKTHSEACSG